MKKVNIIHRIGNSIVAVLCVIAAAFTLTGCGDDEAKETKLPTILFQQWIGPGDGYEAQNTVYDLSKQGKISMLQQPTAAYAAQAGMSAANFYLVASFPIDVEMDTKTGVIYINDGAGGNIRATNLTETRVYFEGVAFQALTEPVKSAGNWKYIDDQPVE